MALYYPGVGPPWFTAPNAVYEVIVNLETMNIDTLQYDWEDEVAEAAPPVAPEVPEKSDDGNGSEPKKEHKILAILQSHLLAKHRERKATPEAAERSTTLRREEEALKTMERERHEGARREEDAIRREPIGNIRNTVLQLAPRASKMHIRCAKEDGWWCARVWEEGKESGKELGRGRECNTVAGSLWSLALGGTWTVRKTQAEE